MTTMISVPRTINESNEPLPRDTATTRSDLPSSLELLHDTIGTETRHVAADTTLVAPGAPLPEIFAIQTGSVIVCDQNNLVITQLEAGAFIGALELWTGQTVGESLCKRPPIAY